MSSNSTFICRHCKSRCIMNPRLKGGQYYCGRRSCQQARKNAWERDKLRRGDPSYRSKRAASKKAWYRQYPGDRYQAFYRSTHAGYSEENRKRQSLRNKRGGAKVSVAKIVKTDALSSGNLWGSGLYMLFPYRDVERQKIVKTDALIVEIRHGESFQDILQSRSP